MTSRSLFERLEAATDGPPVAAGEVDRWAVADSVLANVRRILNARQGCCETRVAVTLEPSTEAKEGSKERTWIEVVFSRV